MTERNGDGGPGKGLGRGRGQASERRCEGCTFFKDELSTVYREKHRLEAQLEEAYQEIESLRHKVGGGSNPKM